MGLESAHDFRVGDFLEPTGGDFLVVDDGEDVCDLGAGACAGGRGANDLT